MGADDSDNDEGFVPMKMQIKADSITKPIKSIDSSKRPLDFQGRYVFGQGIFKKQPPEVYNRFSEFLQNSREYLKNDQIRYRQEPVHPYEKYITSNNYRLVYSRQKDKTVFAPQSDDFTNHEIDLSNILSTYNKDHFSMLKVFEPPQADPVSDKDIEFDSRFEGGNLQYAFKNKLEENQYTLFLQNDTNSNGYNQWFYFSLKYTKPGVTYKFKIVNLRKKFSFFKEGMKIVVFSKKDAENNGGVGWRKLGDRIRYDKSEIRKQGDKKYKFYMLSFQLDFEHENDYISVAMNLPYTYSRLIHNLKICEQIAQCNSDLVWTRQSIAHTLANNAVPYLTITGRKIQQLDSFSHKKIQTRNQSDFSTFKSEKKAIIILGRQHPGETWSSFLMEEILYYLAENCEKGIVSELLKKYVFKVFPMVNVDGVVYGNFRCDLGGFDLNRNWKDPDKLLHPQVFGIKEEIQKIEEEYDVVCVFDLHGHSKQYNIFCYSCKNDNISARILPYLISQATPSFYFPYCTFGISKYKETTARAVINTIINNQNVLTIESSFYGIKNQNNVVEQFSPSSFGEMAAALFKSLYLFLQDEQAYITARTNIKGSLKQFIGYEKKYNENDSGSESDPLGDQINLKERIKKILPKSLENVFTEKFFLDESPVKKKKPKKPMKKISVQTKKFETLEPKTNKNQIKHKNQESEQQTFVQRTALTQYKRNSKEYGTNKNSKALTAALSQESNRRDETKQVIFRPEIMKKNPQTNLPFYLRDKPRLVPIKLKNDSLEMFKSAYEYQSAKKKEVEHHESKEKEIPQNPLVTNSFKGNSHRILKIKKREEVGEEFPLLCVLSQSKKKSQLDRMAGSPVIRDTIRINDKKDDNKIFRTYVKNEKLQRIKKNEREKQKQRDRNNATLISKVWRDNIARYGKNLNVFMGDNMKGF